MEDYKISLGALLDANVKGDINKQLSAIKDLSVTISKANLDTSVINDIKKQLSQNGIDINLVFGNASQITNQAQQVGQQIGKQISQGVKNNASVDDVIDKQVTNLMSKYSIAGKKGSKAFNEIRQAVVEYRKELVNANSADIDLDDIFSIISNSADISKVTSALANHMKVVDATKDTYSGLLEYIKQVNNSGTKIHLPESIKQEYGDDFSSMRSRLGKAFTTGKGGDFESFVTELNGQLGNVIDLSQGAEAAFGDLVQKVNSAKGGNFLSGNELFSQGYLDRSEIERDITSAIDIIEEEEKKLAQVSTTTANTIVQNEQKKQQAYQQTAKAQKQVTESESLIKSGANVTTFDHTTNAAREASAYFKQLLEDENAVISVSERFGQLNGLTSFTVNVKRATGEVESLRYALKPILDSDGNETGEFYFGNVGAELNNSGAIKQIQAIENAFADYTAKLAQFKSTNSEILSGLTSPIEEFEGKLSGLKNGTVTIDEMKNAYSALNTEASKITENFSRQLSPIDSAINKLAKGEETIAGLRAEFKGLDNVPKEINTELNKCATLLDKVKQIESEQGRTAEWSKAYREWSNAVDTLKAKLTTLRKEQTNSASTQIFNIDDLKKGDIAYMSKVFNTIEKQMVEINRMAKGKGWKVVDVTGVEEADGKIKNLTLTIKDADGALKKLTMQREKLQGSGKAQYGLMQVGDVKVIETASDAQAKLAQETEKANAKLAEQVNRIQHSFDNNTYEAKYDSLIAKTRQWVNANDESVISTQKLTQAYNEFNIAASNYAKDNSIANRDILIQKEEELGRQLKATTNEVKSQNAEWAKSSKIDSLHQKIQEFYDKNTATHKKWGTQLRNLLAETAHGAQITAERINKIEQEFLQVGNAARKSGKLGLSMFDSIKQQASKFMQWASITDVIMEFAQIVRQGVEELNNLDDILTEISKTSNLTSKQLKELGNTSFESASKYGKSASEYLVGVQEMYRAGFDNASEMAELSLLAQAAGDMDATSANDYLIATNAAYGYKNSVEELNKVLDAQNFITNNSAIALQDMADATSEAGSIAAQYGVEIDELSALIAVAVSKTRESGSEVGTTLKSLFVNLQDTTSKPIMKAFNAVGISMTKMVDGSEQLKTPIELIKELSVVFNELPDGDIRKANILNDIAGKYNANTFAAILSDIESYNNMLELYSHGTGSAAKEAEKSANNWSGSLAKIKNSTNDLIQNFVESDTVIDILNMINNLITGLDKLSESLGTLGTITLGAGLFAGFKNVGTVQLY